MPERTKVRWSQLKVGLLGLAAFVIIFALVFLLTDSKGLFKKYTTLRTYMADAAGMTAGTPVRLNGILIGYLETVRLTNSKDLSRAVEFEMKVQSSYLPIPSDSVVGISAANLLGDKFLNIQRGTSARPVPEGGELPSLTAQDIPELMAQSANVLQTFQKIVGRVDNLLAGVEAGTGNIGLFLKDDELYNRLNALASEGQKLMTDMRTGGGTLSKLLYDDTLHTEVVAAVNRINGMLADLQSGQGTAGKLLKDPALYEDARLTIAEIKGLVADLNAGKGTAGKLLKDEQLHARVEQLTTKLNNTLDRMNAGQGTLGQVMVNPALYDSLNGMTREFQSLAKDIRANPKKFLTIRLTLF